MPIEVMAKRGIKTMLYGPMKPVGLEYPEDYKGHDGDFKTPYAVVPASSGTMRPVVSIILLVSNPPQMGEQKMSTNDSRS